MDQRHVEYEKRFNALEQESKELARRIEELEKQIKEMSEAQIPFKQAGLAETYVCR